MKKILILSALALVVLGGCKDKDDTTPEPAPKKEVQLLFICTVNQNTVDVIGACMKASGKPAPFDEDPVFYVGQGGKPPITKGDSLKATFVVGDKVRFWLSSEQQNVKNQRLSINVVKDGVILATDSFISAQPALEVKFTVPE